MKGLRIDRRRRMLSEDWHQPQGDAPRAQSELNLLAEPRRYTDAASVENHPQVTDFVPRRFRSYLALVGLAVAAMGGLAALHLQVAPLSESFAAIQLGSPQGLDRWLLSLLLGLCGLVAGLVYSLRRHRVDDYRARYRVWLWVIGLCLLASVNAVSDLHRPIAQLLAQATGWSALPHAAVWWLLPTALVAGWVGLRLAIDVAECRAALATLLLAAGAFVFASLPSLGWSPLANAQLAALLPSLAALSAGLLLALSLTLYARFVVLDVQGLIEHRARSAEETPKSEAATSAPREQTCTTNRASSSSAKRGTQRSAQSGDSKDSSAGEWIDGSDPEADGYEEQPQRKRLSKAQRKRLRKQHERRAA